MLPYYYIFILRYKPFIVVTFIAVYKNNILLKHYYNRFFSL